MPNRVDHPVRTTTASQLAYHVGKIIFVLTKIKTWMPRECALQALVHQIHADDLVDPLLLCDPARHVADRPEAQDE
jgi:hypothetical protein